MNDELKAVVSSQLGSGDLRFHSDSCLLTPDSCFIPPFASCSRVIMPAKHNKEETRNGG